MDSHEHYSAGRLDDAIAAALAEVKASPLDDTARYFLCQLLCFAGDLERADTHLNAIDQQASETLLGVSLLRQLIRAETSRQELYAKGNPPQFLDDPPEHLQLRLRASIAMREGDDGEAYRLLEQAQSLSPGLSGSCDGERFDELCDPNDLTASLFEVLTSNGKYYWIPFERVESIEFQPWKKPLDLLWRQASMVVREGPDGDVYLPSVYAGTQAAGDDRLTLARMTDWRGEEGAPVRGVGQRLLFFGDVDRPILEIGEITFDQADG